MYKTQQVFSSDSLNMNTRKLPATKLEVNGKGGLTLAARPACGAPGVRNPRSIYEQTEYRRTLRSQRTCHSATKLGVMQKAYRFSWKTECIEIYF